MTNKERIKTIHSAIVMIAEAKIMIEKALKGTEEQSHYKSNGKYGFEQLLGYGRPYSHSIIGLVCKLQNNDLREKIRKDYK